MNKNQWMPKVKQFKLNNVKKGRDIDDVTFSDWKSELEKELPSFWESMIS